MNWSVSVKIVKKLFNFIVCNSKHFKKNVIFAPLNMVDVAQVVRASDCGSEGRRFESGLPPQTLP